MRDLGRADHWSSTPEIVEECLIEDHRVQVQRFCGMVIETCRICRYTFSYPDEDPCEHTISDECCDGPDP